MAATASSPATTDLCDAHEAAVQVLTLPWLDLGGRIAFHGQISTIKAFEDNSRVREAVAEPGQGRVLVVDGASSMARAMLGDLLAAKAVENGWEGIVIDPIGALLAVVVYSFIIARAAGDGLSHSLLTFAGVIICGSVFGIVGGLPQVAVIVAVRVGGLILTRVVFEIQGFCLFRQLQPNVQRQRLIV